MKGRRARLAEVAVASTLCFGCAGSDEPQAPVIRVMVEAPADASCIGVSGFEIDVVVGDDAPRTTSVERARPVLARDECVLAPATAFGAVDLDAPVRVEVRGYDGAKQLRVRGSATYVSLRDEEQLTLRLEPAGVAELGVLSIDRTQHVLSGNSLDAVSSFELSVPGQSQLLVEVDDVTRPYFDVGEPWAVAYPGSLAVGDGVSVKVVLSPAGVLTARLVVQPSDNGEYWVGVVDP